MIVRNIEVCSRCGQWWPWRKVSICPVKGDAKVVRRIYVKCRRCGARETVEERKPGAR